MYQGVKKKSLEKNPGNEKVVLTKRDCLLSFCRVFLPLTFHRTALIYSDLFFPSLPPPRVWYLHSECFANLLCFIFSSPPLTWQFKRAPLFTASLTFFSRDLYSLPRGGRELLFRNKLFPPPPPPRVTLINENVNLVVMKFENNLLRFLILGFFSFSKIKHHAVKDNANTYDCFSSQAESGLWNFLSRNSHRVSRHSLKRAQLACGS